MSVKCVCPECRMSITAPAGAASVTCPICDTAVAVPAASPRGAGFQPANQTAGKMPAPREGATVSQRRRLVFGLLGALAVLWLGGGIAAALYFFHPSREPAAPQVHLGPTTPAVEIETRLVTLPPPDPPPPPPPVTEEQKRINAAIDKGVVYLKAQLKIALTEMNPDLAGNGGLQGSSASSIGVMALMGLTLLECGVAPDDADLKRAAEIVRATVPQLTHTYTIAATLWFLDRLGDKRDAGAVRTLALRLMAGQLPTGCWTYNCAVLTTEEEKGLSDFLKGGLARPGRVGTFPVVLGPAQQKPFIGNFGVDGDNSNAQFAVLALWVARRHGINVQPSLLLVDRYFRKYQFPNGGWDYCPTYPGFKGSMTCAGLLALAVVRSDNVKALSGGEPEKDAAIEKGFRFLSGVVGDSAPRSETAGYKGTIIQADAIGDLYFLWSLERTAVVYDLKMIGGTDWYAWASKVIVGAQQADGSWRDLYPGRCDTCFALLVLKRANIVQDLTSELKKAINLKDIDGSK